MKAEILEYLGKFDEQANSRFYEIYELIRQSVSGNIQEKLWANLPSFYSGDNFVRIILFKDHLNIEAKTIIKFKENLAGYKITPKGMLQIYYKNDIPREILKNIFVETLTQNNKL